jgi:hypothetical protein
MIVFFNSGKVSGFYKTLRESLRLFTQSLFRKPPSMFFAISATYYLNSQVSPGNKPLQPTQFS